jgi:predicted nucleic acid-binding protein
MVRYLLDTNAVSKFLLGEANESQLLFLEKIISEIPLVSLITQVELLAWRGNALAEKQFYDFLQDSIIFPVDQTLVQEAVNIRVKHKLKLPDAFIGATAVVNRFTLVTYNERDFANIKGLKLINPAKMV